MSPTTICLAGKNDVAVDALLYMIERGWKDQLVVCPNRSDSGSSTWQPSLVRFAREFGVPVVALEAAEQIQDVLFISLEFDRIIRPSSFSSRRLYNFHFSALPAYKGMYTSAHPILQRETRSGVTLHEIDRGIDTGRIIDQVVFDLLPDWTARDLYFAYMENTKSLFRKRIDYILSPDAIVAVEQSSIGSSYYSRDSLHYGDISIRLNDTAEGIVRQLRAFSFREYQTPQVAGVPIGGWTITSRRSKTGPGTVVWGGPTALTVSTIDYDLELTIDRQMEWFRVTTESSDYELDALVPGAIDTRDAKGWTPLIRAAYRGDAGLCRILLQRGANPNTANMNGTTPIMYAYSGLDRARGIRTAQELRRFGADSSLKDRFGKSLHDYHHDVLPSIECDQGADLT
ncbi:formyltransferase family protein [Devosia sp.]|uniref:formyltransferase family protein n=1 Tax=Devosia sp. TaxID=1871048 RepID=UPI002735748D|nr:formyltransferase family protein [Devosia sp.]MDP2782148.1 formyltransferase family protein [Devosia sp.]